jgi:asparagine synthase (glutamine-hydrolysing)
MCGIVGFHNPLGPDEKRRRVQAMMQSLLHRGPDDGGYYVEGDVALGFRRLAIIDLESGNQPLCNEDRRIWIVFNGEIYNFRALRQDLEARSHRFTTKTDTEVIVHAYEEWGIGCLERLSGMFSFGIWDANDQQLFLAVDRSGIKPLYFSHYHGHFVFASEVKAILQSGLVPMEPDYETLPYHLAFLTAPFPRTMFRHVKKLSPGHYLLFREGRPVEREYWDLRIDEDPMAWAERPFDRIAASIERATKSQSTADVPLGAFLSGGLDSSAICHFLNQATDGKLQTYFIAYDEKDMQDDVLMDERPYADQMARALGTQHRSIYATTDRLDDLLCELVWHMDEPVGDPAALTTYLVSRHARETLKVLLSGVGGDEVFAGYPRYLAMVLLSRFHHLPRVLQRSFHWLAAQVPGGRSAFFRNCQKFSRAAREPADAAYLDMLTYFHPAEQKQLLTRQFRAQFGHVDVYRYHREYLDRSRAMPLVNRLQYLDYKTFLPCLNLMYTDKMSMAASIEVRVPYLDDALVQEMFRLPVSLKIRRGQGKFALKKAMQGRLPHDVIWRKKAGFGAPIHAWIRGQLRDMVETYLGEEKLKEQGIFNPAYVRQLLDQEYSNKRYLSNHIWELLTIQLWDQVFVGDRGKQFVRDTTREFATAR